MDALTNALGTLCEYCDNAMVTAWEYQRAVLLGLAGCNTPRVSMVRAWEDLGNIIGIIRAYYGNTMGILGKHCVNTVRIHPVGWEWSGSTEGSTMAILLERHGNSLGVLWECYGNALGTLWEESMGVLWECYGVWE